MVSSSCTNLQDHSQGPYCTHTDVEFFVKVAEQKAGWILPGLLVSVELRSRLYCLRCADENSLVIAELCYCCGCLQLGEKSRFSEFALAGNCMDFAS